jgi:tetratricopeptide (TPR) repeat protein
MIEVKTSGELGSSLETLPFGMKVRYCRLKINMSAEQVGILYAEAIGRDEPYGRRRMEQMELHDGFPQDKGRRWAIAKIVQMGLFFKLNALGIDVMLPEQKPIISSQFLKTEFDINQYQDAFKQGWTQPFSGMLQEAETEIFQHITTIYQQAPYLNKKQKKQAWRTLCGFHILLATDIYGAQNNALEMSKQTDMAILLAKLNKYPDLHSVALFQRGQFLKEQWNFPAAIANYQEAVRIKGIPEQLRGKILASLASAQTRLAQTQKEMSEALNNLDTAETLIGKSTLDDFGFLVAFGEDKYRLSRGGALIGSPVKKLRSPDIALSYLPKVYRVDELQSKDEFMIIGHRQAHNHILQAEIYIDQGKYPIAVALAEEALVYAVGVQSHIHLTKLARICQMLKDSPYGDTLEVSMLEIGIVRNMQPELFN